MSSPTHRPSSWLPVPTPWARRLEGETCFLSVAEARSLRSKLPPGVSFPRLFQASLPVLRVADHPWCSLFCSTSLQCLLHLHMPVPGGRTKRAQVPAQGLPHSAESGILLLFRCLPFRSVPVTLDPLCATVISSQPIMSAATLCSKSGSHSEVLGVRTSTKQGRLLTPPHYFLPVQCDSFLKG